jgi:hypothetical protein
MVDGAVKGLAESSASAHKKRKLAGGYCRFRQTLAASAMAEGLWSIFRIWMP